MSCLLVSWRLGEIKDVISIGFLACLARAKVSCLLVSWRAWRFGESKDVMSIGFLAYLAAWREQRCHV